MPLFSVVIPTYNRAGFVTPAVASVLAQDFADFEIIVIDDGSTDETEAVLREAFGQIDKVRYFKQNNSERGAARNRGISEARGQYVVFLDSDDQMYADHLSALKEIIERRPAINFLATKYEFIRHGSVYSAGLEWIKEGEYATDFFLRGAPIGSVFSINKNNPNLKWFEEDRGYASSEDWMFLVQNLVDDKIYIANRVTIRVNDHDARSMRMDNQQVIERKLKAKDWIIRNVRLNDKQISDLKGHTYYFCAIHSYLDHRRKDALKYVLDSIKTGGINRGLAVLLVKALLGRRFVQRIKRTPQTATAVSQSG